MFSHQTDGAYAIAQGGERILVCFLLDHENSKPWRDGLLQGAGIHLPAIDVDDRAWEVSRQRRTAENSEVCIGSPQYQLSPHSSKRWPTSTQESARARQCDLVEYCLFIKYKSIWETLVMQSSGEYSE